MATLSREAEQSERQGTLEWGALWTSAWALLPILLAAFVVYAPTLRDWFTGDDFWFLRASQTHSIGDQVWRSFDYRNVGASLEFDRYRPLYPIAWRLEYAVFGTHAFYYHAVVVALHVASTAVVWLIARRLFRDAWARNLAALIFAVHPAYIDAISWVSGGNRAFAALPYLLAMLYFMRWCDESGGRRIVHYALAWALFTVAVLFHSSALMLAAVLPLYAFLVAGEAGDALRLRAWVPYVPFALVVGVSALIQVHVRANVEGGDAFRFGYHVYANYGGLLGRAVVPIDAQDVSGWPHTPLSVARGAGSLLVLALSVGLATRRPAWGLGIFAAAWFYLALLPDTTLILGPSGRMLYIAGAALALTLVALLLWLRDVLPPAWSSAAVRLGPIVLALAIPLTMFATYGRTLSTSHDASRNEAFLTQLRRDVPVLPPGRLYVANAPFGVTLFGTSSRLDAMVEIYYGDARVQYVAPDAVAGVQATLKPEDRLYIYTP